MTGHGSISVLSLGSYPDAGGPALYAGGYFAVAGTVAASSIAKWQRCYCPADLDQDGDVDGVDLNLLLGNWGACASDPCLGDLDENGVVDSADLAILLAATGPCP
jgi:hypothetical protein